MCCPGQALRPCLKAQLYVNIEDSDGDIFLGLKSTWEPFGLSLSPSFRDPWTAVVYRPHDAPVIKPWAPSAQKKADIFGLLSRCWYQSNNPAVCGNAIFQAILLLIHRAKFPSGVVYSCACKWAKTWKPPGGPWNIPDGGPLVEAALKQARKTCARHKCLTTTLPCNIYIYIIVYWTVSLQCMPCCS